MDSVLHQLVGGQDSAGLCLVLCLCHRGANASDNSKPLRQMCIVNQISKSRSSFSILLKVSLMCYSWFKKHQYFGDHLPFYALMFTSAHTHFTYQQSQKLALDCAFCWLAGYKTQPGGRSMN